MRVDTRPRAREVREEDRAEREHLRRPPCPLRADEVSRRADALISELFAVWQDPEVVRVAARFLLDLASKGSPTRDGRSAIERSHRYYSFAGSERVCETAMDAVIRHLSIHTITLRTAQGLGVKLRDVPHIRQYGPIRVASDRQRRLAATIAAKIVHRTGNIVDAPGRSFVRQVDVDTSPKGSRLFGRCVAHDDEHPSMQINDDGGCWCFACGKVVGRVVTRDGRTVRIAVFGEEPKPAEPLPLPGEVQAPAVTASEETTTATTPTTTTTIPARRVRGRGGRFARFLAASIALEDAARAGGVDGPQGAQGARHDAGPQVPPPGFLIAVVRSANNADESDPPCTRPDPSLVAKAGQPVPPSRLLLKQLESNGATSVSGWEQLPHSVSTLGSSIRRRGPDGKVPPREPLIRRWSFGSRPAYNVLSKPPERVQGDLPNEFAGRVVQQREVDSDRSLFEFILNTDARRTGPAGIAEMDAYSEGRETKRPGGLWHEYVSIDRMQATVSRKVKTSPLSGDRYGETTRFKAVRWKSVLATHILVDLDDLEGPLSPASFQAVAHKLEDYAKSRPWLGGHFLAVRTSDTGIQVLFNLKMARMDPEAFRRDPNVRAAQREAEAVCMAVAREAGFTGGFADRTAGLHNRRARLPGPRVDKTGRAVMAYVIATSMPGWRGKADPWDLETATATKGWKR